MHTSPTPQDFLERSLQLIQARPATTRITTKYSSPSPRTLLRLSKKHRRRQQNPASTTNPGTSTIPSTTTSTGTLNLKTYDPVSGATIRFSTTRGADVGRLLGVLARAAKGMGGVGSIVGSGKDGSGDTVMGDAGAATEMVEKVVEETKVEMVGSGKSVEGGTAGGEKAQGGQGGQGGKGKKKKGGRK